MNGTISKKITIMMIISEVIAIILMDLVIYNFLGISFKQLMTNLPRTIVVQLTVLISCIIPIYFIARKITSIERKTTKLLSDEEKLLLKNIEKKVVFSIIVVNLLGWIMGPLVGVTIRVLAEGIFRSATLRFSIVSVIFGPLVGLMQIIIIGKYFQTLKLRFDLFETETVKTFFTLKTKFYMTFLLAGLFIIMVMGQISISKIEKICGISDSIYKSSKYTGTTNGYFTELLNKAEKSSDPQLQTIAIEIKRNYPQLIKNEINHISLAAIVVFFIFALSFFLFSTNMHTQLQSIIKRLSTITKIEGDLSILVVKTDDSEIGEIQVLINRLIHNLNTKFQNFYSMALDIINKTKDETQNINTLIEAMNEIKQSNMIMNEKILLQKKISSETTASAYKTVELIQKSIERITNQSTMIEQVSSSTTEMTSSITSVSQSTKKANELTYNLSQASVDGSKTTDDMNLSITNISKIGIVISEILNNITSITDQTGILSMNAAIEAAHAGESGKGFAVVADEMRKLSENTNAQTYEIGKLIKDMENIVGETVKNGNNVVFAMEIIKNDINNTSNLISEIDIATKEQAINSNENLKAIKELVCVTSDILNNLENEKKITDSLQLLSKELNDSTDSIETVKLKQNDYNEKLEKNLNEISMFFIDINEKMHILEKNITGEKK
ncbi:MAG: hypothetical protein A2015_04505 [Spirochaetes bacterium GWF1_31_7]|nr:MAG: hypothetical protein A2Y30_16765 [Spirochaetes bacterium GWE1_32_154]OHD51585.1 MAG: hypothetical protein A2Y29_07510 [Spirochaetes bacterium GWE2_31_10]OHD52981.1 MAG: hypothetical protein A2015_04505 [Spirochaetes bacterium GWF1_31_7]OHD82209.1 MAG: hypothetical protein A2355_12445 [Spirochaetes bacterium RIFOXYB1_FULL_32_8]HBD93726.1 hypothetical protein [Spirochaetia bacterium]